MARERCPGCGAPYNGKRCHRCFYQPMTTVRAPSSRRPESRKKTALGRKPSSALRSLLGFVILLALIAMLLPMLRNWGTDLKATAESHAAGNPLYATGSMD